MQTKISQSSASSQHEEQIGESEGSIVRHIHDPDAPLSPELLRELETLAALSDDEIDCSDIPQLTDEQLGAFVRRSGRALESHTVNLLLVSEVYEWLQSEARPRAQEINFALKQLAKQDKR